MNLSRVGWLTLSGLFVLLAIWGFVYRSQVLSSGKDSLGSARPVEGRLSRNDAYSSYRPEQKLRLTAQQVRAIRKVKLAIRERHDLADSLADGAFVDLIGGQVDQAVQKLEMAVHRDPSIYWLWSDLSAVYLAQGAKTAPAYYVKALNAAKRARKINSEEPLVLFNFALALEKCFLREQAISAWLYYVKKDPHSPWSQEARRRINNLNKPSLLEQWQEAKVKLKLAALNGEDEAVRDITASFIYFVRRYAEEEVLGDWAEFQFSNQLDKAAEDLAVARKLGVALATHDDPFVQDLVAVIDRIRAVPLERRINLLAEAHMRSSQGRSSCLNNQGRRGATLLLEAREVLIREGSPLYLWDELYLAVCAYERSEFDTSLAILDGLLSRPRLKRYPNLLAKCYWIMGMSYLASSKMDHALHSYRAARKIYLEINAWQELGAIDYLVAENLRLLGELDESWKALYRGLEVSIAIGDARREYAAFDELADAVSRTGFLEESLYFRDEVVRIASKSPDPAGLAYALLKRGETLFALKRILPAIAALESAEKNSRLISDPDARRRWEGEIYLVQGKVREERNPKSAITYLDLSLKSFRGTDQYLSMIDLRGVRARCFIAVGDVISAESELLKGIAEFEKRSGEMQDYQLRMSYLEQGQELFDLMVEFQISTYAQSEKAFNFAERSRARVLLEQLSRRGRDISQQDVRNSLPLGVKDIQESLSQGVAVIEYAVLEDELIAWVVRNDSLAVRRVSISRDVLTAQVSELTGALRRGIQGEGSISLYNILIQPIADLLGKDDLLVVVPDKVLHGLPFSVLRDPASGRRLLEMHTITYSPSATIFAHGLGMEEQNGGLLNVLALGNPRFDKGVFATLPDLPSAEQEAMMVASMYAERAGILTGIDATKERFLKEAGGYTIIHIAAHSKPDPLRPFRSAIVLASSKGGDGNLAAEEIQDLSFRSTSLVILAVCGLGYGETEAQGGAQILSYAFLAAGVPGTVSGLWKVEDDAALALFKSFHGNVKNGESPAAALRSAQLDMMHSLDPRLSSPSTWGSFQVFGGTSPISG